MDQDEIFKTIQKYLSEVPVFLIGTGGTIPHGLPGMPDLAEYLIRELNEKYKADSKWDQFAENLRNDMDLESALTDLDVSKELLQDITNSTWQLISDRDIELFKKIVCYEERLPLGGLIAHFFRPYPQCVHIITTNYDRVVEYACDQIKVAQANLFEGRYVGEMSNQNVQKKNIVNILKVHGSLDWFEDSYLRLRSYPQQSFIWDGHKPKIIPPGSTKYKAAFDDPYRTIIHRADEQITSAKCFLCIGYGFNDEHIQSTIISAVSRGTPIVVVTKSISEKAASLVCNNASKSAIIQQDPDQPNFTEFIINKRIEKLEGTYWTINGLLNIIT